MLTNFTYLEGASVKKFQDPVLRWNGSVLLNVILADTHIIATSQESLLLKETLSILMLLKKQSELKTRFVLPLVISKAVFASENRAWHGIESIVQRVALGTILMNHQRRH